MKPHSYKSIYGKFMKIKTRLEDCRHPAAVKELAFFMNCSERSIYRYLREIERENINLKKTKGFPCRYFIISQNNAKKPHTLIKSLESIESLLKKQAETPQAKIIRKTVSYLKGETIPDIEPQNHAINIDSDFIIDLGPFSEADPLSRNYDILERDMEKFLYFIKCRKKVQMTYEAGYNGEKSKIVISPMKLILRIDTLYLLAEDENKKIKLFAFRRIKNFRSTGIYFPEIKFNYSNLYRNCCGKFTASDKSPKINLRMTVKAPWLQTLLKEAHFNPPLKIKNQNPMEIELFIYATDDFKRWLLSLLPWIKINGPASLIDEMKQLLNESAKAL